MVYHDSPWFDLDSKTGVNRRISSFSTVFKGSIRVSYVFLVLYEFTTVCDVTSTDNKDK